MDSTAYEHFTSSTLGGMLWRPWTPLLSAVSHPPERIMVALTNMTLIRAAAVPLQKKLGMNAVLLAFFTCSFAATLFNAVYGMLTKKSTSMTGSTYGTVGLLLLLEALLPGQQQMHFFSLGPLSPLHMAGAVVLLDGVVNKGRTLPGFVG